MTTETMTVKHAFLSPSHNAWSMWTWEGTQSITNPGTSHRTLESLSFALDKMVSEGWQIQTIHVEQGTPTLVVLRKDLSQVADEEAPAE